MMNKRKTTHQIRVTLTEDNYNRLKEYAEKNYRTIAQEVNYRLNHLLSRPGGPDAPAPIIYPAGVRGLEPGIPEEPYKITLKSDTANNK